MIRYTPMRENTVTYNMACHDIIVTIRYVMHVSMRAYPTSQQYHQYYQYIALLQILICVCIYIYIYIYAYVDVCISIYVYIYIYIYVYTHMSHNMYEALPHVGLQHLEVLEVGPPRDGDASRMYVYIYIYIYIIHTCMHVYIYIYIYIHTHRRCLARGAAQHTIDVIDVIHSTDTYS